MANISSAIFCTAPLQYTHHYCPVALPSPPPHRLQYSTVPALTYKYSGQSDPQHLWSLTRPKLIYCGGCTTMKVSCCGYVCWMLMGLFIYKYCNMLRLVRSSVSCPRLNFIIILSTRGSSLEFHLLIMLTVESLLICRNSIVS